MGLVAQLTQGAAPIGIVLVVRAHTGSLALAGVVVGGLSIAAGLSRPLQGRLIDRRGAAGVMAVCGVVHGAALIGIVAFSGLRATGGLLIVLGAVAGLALPPVSTSMRVIWAALVPEDGRTAAYSLVYLVQELAIFTGPLILATLLAAWSAALALVTVAALSGVGTLAFAASVRVSGNQVSPSRRATESVLRPPGMRVLVAIAALIGGVIGGLDVAAPTLATAHGAPAASGLLIAALAIGGIAGGAIYGARRWRAAPSRRLVLLLALVSAPIWLMVAVQSLLFVGALLVVAGLALNPALTTISLLVDQHASGPSTAEAFGWLSTGIAGGTGAASAIAGVVAQHQHDAQAAFILSALAGASAATLATLTRRTLARTRSALPAIRR
jgi:predicted MFS family arabinose efflux permease